MKKILPLLLFCLSIGLTLFLRYFFLLSDENPSFSEKNPSITESSPKASSLQSPRQNNTPDFKKAPLALSLEKRCEGKKTLSEISLPATPDQPAQKLRVLEWDNKGKMVLVQELLSSETAAPKISLMAIANEMMVSLNPGKTKEDLSFCAQKYGLIIQSELTNGVYLLQLSSYDGKDPQALFKAVAKMQQENVVKTVEISHLVTTM
jgi:hypothetical protein